jgi:multidrug efflux pump subunit AcrB
LRDTVDEVRKQLLQLPDISKIDILGAQDERVYVEFSTEQLAGLGIDRAALVAALQAQNAVTPSGVLQMGEEKILVRVSGAFNSEQDILAVNFVTNGRMIRLGDIAHVTRGPADPVQPMFRVNGRDGIGLAIAMRKGGDVVALGRNLAEVVKKITANLPVGIEPTLIANQPVTVEHAVGDFMEALWESIAIVLGVSLVALGLRSGAVVALSIPLVLAAVFVTMMSLGIDLQRISLGALIIALGLLVDDAMIAVEAMVARLELGDEKEHAATFAYSSTAFPMLTDTLVTIAGFVPIGFARSAAGEYTFSIFAVVAIALIASWCVAVLFAPLLGLWILRKPKAVHAEKPGRLPTGLSCSWICNCQKTRRSTQQRTSRPAWTSFLPAIRTSTTGGAVRFYLRLNVQLPNDFFAQAVVVTKGLEQRERVKAKLERGVATDFPNLVGRVYPLELGPPVGWPLQYRVSGPEADRVRAIAIILLRHKRR